MPPSQPSVRRCPQLVAAKQDKDPVWGLPLGSWLLPDQTAGRTLCLVQGRAQRSVLAAILTQPLQHIFCWGWGCRLCWSCSEGAGQLWMGTPVVIHGLCMMSLQAECKLGFYVCCVILKVYLSGPGGACWWFAFTSDTAICYCVCWNWIGTGSVSAPWLGNDRLAAL